MRLLRWRGDWEGASGWRWRRILLLFGTPGHMQQGADNDE